MGFWNWLFGSKKKPEKDLQMILSEIDSLSSSQDIQRKIILIGRALSLVRRQSSPELWAALQMALGNSLCQNPQENRAENLEKAIELYNQALEVYTRKDFPIYWAMTQSNLANAYRDRIRGNRAENLERAIEFYNLTLEVRTRKDFPIYWAKTQGNLANAHLRRIRGDRAENLEKAIEHVNQALEVYTRKDFPVEWATTQIYLANAHLHRIRGDIPENLEKAIEHVNQALEVYTCTDFPVEWATTQINLANAYFARIRGDKAENLEKAIELYNQALEVYTHTDFPVEWAMTQSYLAGAYHYRIRGDRVENLEKAIELYNQALELRTRKDFPVDWAITRIDIGLTYRDRIRGDKAENLEKAISHYHSALDIYKIESMPNDFRKTCRLLGDLYLDMEQWKNALESYKDAIKADYLLYRSSLSTQSKIHEIKENGYVYQNAAVAACSLGLSTDALLILEKGKTRLLREALRLKIKQLSGVPSEKWINYERAAEKYRAATKPSEHKKDYIQTEKEAKRALEELDASVKVVQNYNPEFQKELEISDILSILDEETALLIFCVTDKGGIGFIVSKSIGIKSFDISDFKAKDLNNLFFKPDEEGLITGGWIGDYLSYLNATEVKRYDAFQTWQRTLNDVLTTVGSRLLSPLLADTPPQIKKLIFLPSGGLFLLPLHAIPLSNGQLLCQRYSISYAPSIQLLKEMQNKAEKIKGKNFYAVNPQEDPSLVFSEYEVQTISKFFNSPLINIGETGTRATVLDRIPGRAYIHFSCHGSYNWNDPPQSGLYLVGGRTLSLADLQNDIVDMSLARLVTLSACETGITDVLKGSADEFVGLPAGFMLAGVPCVVSSLWSVPEISTALLMERFYSNHIVGGMDIPMALQDAQLWVRDLTAKQVADYVEKCYQSGKWEGKSKDFIEQYREHYLKIAKESPEERPFQHPYYWAAFTVNGA